MQFAKHMAEGKYDWTAEGKQQLLLPSEFKKASAAKTPCPVISWLPEIISVCWKVASELIVKLDQEKGIARSDTFDWIRSGRGGVAAPPTSAAASADGGGATAAVAGGDAMTPHREASSSMAAAPEVAPGDGGNADAEAARKGSVSDVSPPRDDEMNGEAHAPQDGGAAAAAAAGEAAPPEAAPAGAQAMAEDVRRPTFVYTLQTLCALLNR